MASGLWEHAALFVSAAVSRWSSAAQTSAAGSMLVKLWSEQRPIWAPWRIRTSSELRPPGTVPVTRDERLHEIFVRWSLEDRPVQGLRVSSLSSAGSLLWPVFFLFWMGTARKRKVSLKTSEMCRYFHLQVSVAIVPLISKHTKGRSKHRKGLI